MRPSGRVPDELRPVTLETEVSKHAEGSCLARFGDTHVLCTASIEEGVPPWLRNSGNGKTASEALRSALESPQDLSNQIWGTEKGAIWCRLRKPWLVRTGHPSGSRPGRFA